jgi:DNA-binding MarR family transcriptional regulator
MALSEQTIALIKAEVEGSDIPLAKIGEKYGVSATYISRLSRTNDWVTRSQRRGHRSRTPVALSTAGRSLIAQRLRGIINKKLDQMEKEMDSGKLDATDLERNAKSVTTMITGLDKVTTGADGEGKQRARREKAVEAEPNSDAADLSEVERLQREIIERFERIQRRRDAEGGSA